MDLMPRSSTRRPSARPSRRSLTLLVAAFAVASLALTGCAGGASGSGSGSGSADSASADARVALEAVSPATGSLTGGAEVTVAGSGFDGDSPVATVRFGAEAAPSFAVVDDRTLTVVTPASVDFAVAAVPVTVTLEDGSEVVLDGGFGYEVQTPVDSQMNYAFTYWKDYNLAEWGQFPDNDCGNFVNQAMLARGWVQDENWYSEYATTGDYSYSWIRGNQMDAYYASRPDTTRLEITQRDQVKIGDVVMFDWDPQNDNGVDHTMIVSKVTPNLDGTIAIKMVGHTLDAQYRDLDTAITVEKPGGTAHFWSIA
ncbi:amidase domain-containing protein [Herbiconiux sp. VKM Ac-2851]|uniref:amidase domain-containing protein n=1 Tax=Herbiconiux sp. VKM Ac-2851 TaxID=2739025 RepID=UPI0015653C31|nr:amidase domain-containing protein [Herbiconiux sp. VKM Ac-2851]NQX34600.1 amidase domain-containing protein [Herbiconiux sp. VKM Ac-2851]